VKHGRRIAIALTYGIVNHALFVVAIAVMVAALHGGLATGLGRLEGGAALAVNTLLALQFPLVHSFLLSRRGRATLVGLAPRAVGSDLAPTTFTALASVQLLVTFLGWSPSGIVLYEASGWTRWILELLYAASWLLLLKAMIDARLSIQTGSIGWTAVMRGKRPEFGTFPTNGLFRVCRQPVYLAFAATLWTGPVLTLDRLALALAWTSYCLVGPLHKERRYLSFYGALYSNYRRRVPYFIPGVRS